MTAPTAATVLSADDWADEATSDAPAPSGVSVTPFVRAPSLRAAASMIRSSFNASTRFLRMGSTTGHSDGRSSSGKGIRESTQGFFNSLLNAVGMGHKSSPSRDVSPSDIGRSKLVTSQSRNLARLSSVSNNAMRQELQHFSQFGDLRNDSFSNPATSKLMKRNSLHGAQLNDASVHNASPPRGGGHVSKSGSISLARHSSPAPAPKPTSGRPSMQGMTPPSAPPDAASGVASPSDVRPGLQHLTLARTSLGATGPLADDHFPPVRRGSQGAGRSPVTVAVAPHPPPYPPPPAAPRPHTAGSPTSSRPPSAERLPPMSRSPSSTRDRPPTPRGRTSSSGSSPSKLSKVLGSFRLPEILTGSGKSVTERRSSVTAGSAGGAVSTSFTRPNEGSVSGGRAHRLSSAGGGLMVKASGGSFLGGVQGPGGAAIRDALAKRAAQMSAAAAAAGGGGAAVSPSAPSSAGLMRPSAPSVTARLSSATAKPPSLSGGILENFRTSLALEEEGALAAVEAEFDRRFGRVSNAVPASIDSPQAPPLPPRSPQQAHVSDVHETLVAGMSGERTASPQVIARRRSNGEPRSGGGGGSGGGLFASAEAAELARQSCSAVYVADLAASGDELLLSSSYDAAAGGGPDRLNAKMRLASIRLSYAEGIVGGMGATTGRQADDPVTLGQVPGAVASPSPQPPEAPLQPRPEKVSPRVALTSAGGLREAPHRHSTSGA